MNEEENKKAQSKGKRWIIIGAAVAAVIVIVTIVLLATGVWGHKDLTNTETTTEKKQEETTKAEKETTKEQTKQETTQTSDQQSVLTSEWKISNAWKSGNTHFYQYAVTISNSSDVSVSGWRLEVEVPKGTKLSQFWCCLCSLEGTTLTIFSEDYNSTVGANGSINDIGIILEAQTEMEDFTANVMVTAPEETTTEEASETAPAQPETTAASQQSNNSTNVPESGTPLANHGKLSLKGTGLVDCNGNAYQLKGVSTHGIAWFPQYVSKEAFQTLRDDWGCNMVRIAMYSAENGGYCTGGDKAALEATVCKGVDACTELGMYAIIDWHILSDGNPNTNKASAIDFFTKMAQKYCNNNNVIYEICNEPVNTGWTEIKAYADTIIPIIRQYDSDAIILVGTPNWSQNVDEVVNNQVSKPSNVMYVVHFYAATHKDWLRDKVKNAVSAGVPVFISEFSICDASGNGGIDYDSADKWKKLINDYNLSYAGWSLCNKAETSALINSSCSKTSGWSTEDLSDAGKWLRNMIMGK